MKPIKGMNLDVSPDSQPPNTYRHARNWVYDKDVDGLSQEMGAVEKAFFTNYHIIGQYAYENGDIVFLTVAANSPSASDSVHLYSGVNNTYTEILNTSELNFHRSRVYDITGFRNSKNERIIVFTDNVEPVKVLNIDLAVQPTSFDLQYLFPGHKQAEIDLAGHGTGLLDVGTYFLSVQYEMEDGTVLPFGPVHGPYRVAENGTSLSISLSNLDTNFKSFRVGVIAQVGGSSSAYVTHEGSFNSTTASVEIYGTVKEELILEDILVTPTTYARAEAVEMHDNRLYLGNVSAADEDANALQGFANEIQPIWYLPRTYGASSPIDETEDDPDARFQPDEVYAFYISWIRDDGSYTKAYHIPGISAKFVDAPIQAAAADGVSNTSVSLSPTATITSIVSDTAAGGTNENQQLRYLENDRRIFTYGSDQYDEIKYFHTRGTATAFTNQVAYHFGECGFWENANEQYPADFPDKLEYSWFTSGLGVHSTDDVSLAGANVRHHRLPSIAWMYENVPDFALTPRTNTAFKMRFEYVRIPSGMSGAVIYHAKRNNTNNVVLSHTPVHFGAADHYSIWGEGGAPYKDYSTVSTINAPMHNSLFHVTGNIGGNIAGTVFSDIVSEAGSPRQIDGTTFSNADLYEGFSNSTTSWSDWVNSEYQDRTKVHYNKCIAMPHDLLGTRPKLPQYMYTRFEYMLIDREEYPNDVEGNPGGLNNGRTMTMSISDSLASNYYSETSSTTTNIARRSTFYMNQLSTDVDRPRPQSEVQALQAQRYIAAGTVDDEVKFDNRFGNECFYAEWNPLPSASASPYTVSGYHGLNTRIWYSVLNANTATYTTSYGGTNYNQYNRNGFWVQHMYSTNKQPAISRLPFVNINAMRFDCYYGYESQDLVACTSVITDDNTTNGLNIGSVGSAGRRVTQDLVHGDIYYSRRRYRVTSATGFNAGINATDEGGLASISSTSTSNLTTRALQSVDLGGTLSNRIGTMTSVYTVPTYGPLQSFLHDKDKVRAIENDWDALYRDASPSETNDVTFNSDLTRLNDWRQPSVHVYGEEIVTDFYYRVARSASQDLNNSALNIRTFPALDYIEQTRDRGVVHHLQSYGDKLLIHQDQSLFITVGKDSVATSAGQVVLGTGDIFRIRPTEIVPSEYGFAGTQHKTSCTLTPQGYFFADANQGKVFLYNGKLEEISNNGLRYYMREKMKLQTNYFSSPAGAAQSYYPGIYAEYDTQMNRVVMMIRNNDITGDLTQTTAPLNLKSYQSDFNYSDTTEFLSYSFNNNAWVSFHDYRYNAFIGTRDKLYGWRTDQVGADPGTRLFEMNAPTNASIQYQMYDPLIYTQPYIDIAFAANESVQWQSFNWLTKAKNHDPTNAQYGHIDLNSTFVKAAVYNDYQCSGEQTFTEASDIDVLNYQRVTLRHNGTRYQYNGFRDIVNDKTLRFIDEDQNFVSTNLNATLEWYKQRRFNSTYAIIRLVLPQTTTKLLYLYDVDAKVRKAYR